MKFGRVLSPLLFIAFVSSSNAEELVSDLDATGLSPEKLTPLGLYLSSPKAYRVISEDPDILFIDVRDPLEVALMGHPMAIDKIVPVRVQSENFDEELNEYALVPNAHFLQQMELALAEAGKSKHDLIIVTCGSGYRSAEAVRNLSAAGYTNVWQIPDGYVGDEKRGMNTQNAWQNAGLPWSAKLIAETPWVKAMSTEGDTIAN